MTNDIKKAIEEERNEAYSNASNCCPYEEDEYHAYRSGYDSGIDKGIDIILSKWEESTRWRKVEEELPDDNITVLLEIEYDGITDCSTGHFYDKGKKYHLDSELYKDAIITCWKPIH